MDITIPQQNQASSVNNVWRIVKKSVTFDGGTTDAIGDAGGAQDPYAMFNVTGVVAIKVFGHCTTSLEGTSAAIGVGTAENAVEIIALETATEIDAGHIYLDNSAASTESVSSLVEKITAGGSTNKILLDVQTADVTAGVIDFYCLWRPISSDGNVEAT